jgi:hypothetical protein
MSTRGTHGDSDAARADMQFLPDRAGVTPIDEDAVPPEDAPTATHD